MYDYNFGNINFNWGESKETSSFEVILKDINNNERIKHTVNYNELIYNYDDHELNESEKDCQLRIESRFKPINELIYYYITNPKDLYSPFIILLLIMIHLLVLYVILWVFYKVIRFALSFVINFDAISSTNKDDNKVKSN